MHYTVQQWLLFFYIYCFVGWCFESAYVSIRKKRFVNRGFLHSPLLPIYGSGAVVMLLVTIKIRDHIVLMFFAGMIGATALELAVGLIMEAVFKIKYWDYSNQRFNFKGVICLSSSLCWGLFTVLLNKWIHKPVESFVLGLPDLAVTIAVSVISVVFICDTVVSVRVALGLRDMLDAVSHVRKEFEEMRGQFSERVALMRKNITEKSGAAGERLNVLLDSVGEKLTDLSGSVGGRLEDLIDATNEKLNALLRLAEDRDIAGTSSLSRLSERLKALKKEYESQEKKISWLEIKMLKRNPSATSRKFSEEFSVFRSEQFRQYEQRRKAKKEERRKRRSLGNKKTP